MVKVVTLDELDIVAELASNVWSRSKEELLEEFKSTIENKESVLFLKYSEGVPVGFAQCTLRHDYVEGTSSSPVGYLEGIFVKEEYRERGYAKELLCGCEQWAKEQGCKEFASDCELTNCDSFAFHMKTGFIQANIIVCFKKLL